MCGRFTLTTPVERVARAFGLPDLPLLQSRYNVAPGQVIAAVGRKPDGTRRGLALLRWGLVPHWATGPNSGPRPINVRAESIVHKFGSVLREKRCLIPADGFYEWKAEGKRKIPQRFTMTTGEPFAFAGLWDVWGNPGFRAPFAKPRRIVPKIEELTAQSRAARTALVEVPTLLGQFRQSVLASAFCGDLTADWRAKHSDAEPASVLLERIRVERRKQWEAKYPKNKCVEPESVDDSDLPDLPNGRCWSSFGELTHSIRSGNSATATQVDTGHPVLRSSALRHGSIDFGDFSHLDPSASDNADNFVTVRDRSSGRKGRGSTSGRQRR